MAFAVFLALSLLTAVSSGINSPYVDGTNAEACVPTSGTLDTADDVPAIHEAFEECGNGGTILIPESHTYQIASPVNLSSCRSCTFQVDGILNISTTDYSIWWFKEAIFQLSGAKEVTVKGSGLINGNDWKRFPEKANKWNRAPHVFSIADAENIQISGLRIQNTFGIPFNIQYSRDVEVSSISMRNEPPHGTDGSYNSVGGIEVIHSSHLKIHDISIAEVYWCISILRNVTSANISHISCKGTSYGCQSGVVINHYRNGASIQNNHNITFSDLAISNAQWATGIIATGGFVNATDITWRNVRLDGCYTPIMILNCVGLSTACGVNHDGGARFNLERISFQNYSSAVSTPPQVHCYPAPNGTCDVQISKIVVGPPS